MSSRNIEEAVVSMEFDNADFEERINTTMNSIDDLKKSISDTDQSVAFQNLSNSVDRMDLSTIESALIKIQDRFSTMGIIGMTIISNLTNSAIGMISNIGSRIGNAIRTGGLSRASNIEKAKFQLEGLGIAYEDMAGSIDYAVTDTAYGLDAAAQAAAQLSSAAIDYKEVVMTHKADNKELTKMDIALRGISGVAAQTQSDYGMVSRYFEDIANAGKVTGSTLTYMTQVLNLPAAQDIASGLNAIVDGSFEASDAVLANAKKITKGTTVTAEDVKDMCKKGVIDFDTFSTIMFDKYADHAIKANETLEGVKSNIKAAFSKIGADFIGPIIANNGPLVNMLEQVRAKLNEIRKIIKPVSEVLAGEVSDVINKIAERIKGINFKEILDVKSLLLIVNSLKNIFNAILSYLRPIGAAFKEVFQGPSTEAVYKTLLSFDEFTRRLEASSETSEKIKSIFKGFFAIFDLGKQIIQGLLIPIKTLISFITPLGDGIFNVSGSLGDFIYNLDRSAKKSQFFIKVGQKMSDALIKMRDGIVWFVDKVKEKFNELKNYISTNESLKAIVESISDFVDKIKTKFGELASYFKGNFSLKGMIDSIKKGFSDLGNSLKNNVHIQEFVQSFKETLDGLDIDLTPFEKIIDIFKSDAPLIDKIFNSLGELINGAINFLGDLIPKIFELVGKVVPSLKELFNGLLDVFSGGDAKDMSKGFKFTAAVIILKRFIDSISKVVNSANTKSYIPFFGDVSAFVSSWVDLMKGINTSRKQLTEVYVLKNMAIAIAILAGSMFVLSSLDTAELAATTTIIIAFMGILFEFANLLTTKIEKGEKMSSGATSALMLAAAVAILTMAMKKVASIFHKDGIEGLLASASVIIIMVMALAYAAKMLTSKDISASTSQIVTLGASMVLMAVGVSILISALKKVSKVYENIGPEGLLASGLVVVGLLAALAATLKILSTGDTGSTSKIMAVGSSILIMSAGIMVLAAALKVISGIENGVTGSIIAIGFLLVIIGAFTTLVGDNATKMMALAGGLALFGIALMLLIPPLLALSKIGGAELFQGLLALVAVLGTFAIAAAVMVSVAPIMLVLSVAMLALGLACVTLGAGLMLLTTGLITAGGAAALVLKAAELIINGLLSIIEGAIPRVVQMITSFVTESINSLETTIPMFVDFVLNMIITVLEKLKEKMPTIITLVIGLMMDMMMAIAQAFQNINPEELVAAVEAIAILGAVFAEVAIVGILAVAAMVGMAAITGALALCGFLFSLLSGMNLEATMPLMERFADILAKFGEAITLFAAFGALGSIAAITALVPVVTALTVILTALGALSQIPGFDWLIEEGGTVLIKIGEIIGGFIGGIIAGFAAEVVSTLPQIATSLSMFAINLLPFITTMKMVDSSILESIGTLVASMALMAGAELMNSITNFISGKDNISAFGQELAKFGPYMTQYYNTIRGIDGDVVEKSANAALALVQFAKEIPNEGGLLAKITGDNSISDFAKELLLFGPSLMAYALSVKGLNADDVTNSANAAMAITEFANAIPNEGGLVAKITGDNSIASFAEELVLFGPKLMTFADSVKGLDSGVVENATNSAKTLSEMAANLPNSEGVVSWFTGDNTLSVFGEELAAFGPKFKEYSDTIAGIDPEVVTASTLAAQSLAELAANLPNSGGLVSWFSGDNSMSDFGDELASFGEDFVKFYNSVSGIDSLKTYSISKAIADLASILPVLKENDPSLLSTFVSELMNLSDLDIDAITELFNESQTPLTESLTTFFQGIDTVLEEHKETIVDKVREIIEQIKSYLSGEGYEALKTEVVTMCTNIVNTIRLQRSSMYSAGQYITMGFIGGIKSKVEEAAQAAADLAKATYDAAMTTIDANSPSKLFKKVGGYVGAGFVIGIEDYYDRVYQAGAGLADSSINGTTDFMSGIEDVMSDMDDFNPVIRPTLDLSNVMSGAKQVGAIFNNSKLSASVDGSQNGGNNGNASNNVTYNQYNYSPKALSRIDIYRQTRNQLSMSKG